MVSLGFAASLVRAYSLDGFKFSASAQTLAQKPCHPKSSKSDGLPPYGSFRKQGALIQYPKQQDPYCQDPKMRYPIFSETSIQRESARQIGTQIDRQVAYQSAVANVMHINPGGSVCLAQRVPGIVMGDTSPNHNSNSSYRNPTFYYIGTLDPLGRYIP